MPPPVACIPSSIESFTARHRSPRLCAIGIRRPRPSWNGRTPSSSGSRPRITGLWRRKGDSYSGFHPTHIGHNPGATCGNTLCQIVAPCRGRRGALRRLTESDRGCPRNDSHSGRSDLERWRHSIECQCQEREYLYRTLYHGCPPLQLHACSVKVPCLCPPTVDLCMPEGQTVRGAPW